MAVPAYQQFERPRMPDNDRDFYERFSNDAVCLAYLCAIRWPEDFVCPHCAHGDGWLSGQGYWRCSRCRVKTSATAGTIFHRSHLPLSVWFAAIWKVASSKRGISALELQHALGLGSHKTAWTMLHKLRIAMVRPNREVLSEYVQVDETYIGGKEKGLKGRKIGPTKAIVAIAVEVRGPVTGRVRLERIEDLKEPTLTDFVYRNVAELWLNKDDKLVQTVVQTDALQGYNGLAGKGYIHDVINLNAAPNPAHVEMPHVHHVASHLKRWLLGTHQGAVKKRHLDAYLNEFEFRYNRRRSNKRGLLFQRLVEGAASRGPTEFQVIKGGKP